MRVLCVGRHPYLSAHLCRFFEALSIDARPAVGLEGAIVGAAEFAPEVVICDYDLLATVPIDSWEKDALLSRIPVIAVSLTRRPEEVHLLDANAIGGFLYLPTLEREQALRMLRAAAGRRGGVQAPVSLSWPNSSVAQFR